MSGHLSRFFPRFISYLYEKFALSETKMRLWQMQIFHLASLIVGSFKSKFNFLWVSVAPQINK